MKNRLTQLAMKLRIKPRYLIGGLVLLELASLPALAQVINSVSFEVKPHVAAAEIKDGEIGASRFLVSSNAPFSVTAEGMVGELNVEIIQSGSFGETPFGTKAQIPGKGFDCAVLTSPVSQTVYAATQKTAREQGNAVEQAIVMEFRYDENANPQFNFVPAEGIITAESCTELSS